MQIIGIGIMWLLTILYFIKLVVNTNSQQINNFQKIIIQLIMLGILLAVAANFILPIMDYRYYCLIIGFILLGSIAYDLLANYGVNVEGPIFGILISVWLIIQGIPNITSYTYYFAFAFFIFALVVFLMIFSELKEAKIVKQQTVKTFEEKKWMPVDKNILEKEIINEQSITAPVNPFRAKEEINIKDPGLSVDQENIDYINKMLEEIDK